MNAAPYDMIQFFDGEDEDLEIIEVAGKDREWLTVPEPFFPDATLLVVLWQKGVHHIAVRCDDRVAEFDVYKVLLRDGSSIGADR